MGPSGDGRGDPLFPQGLLLRGRPMSKPARRASTPRQRLERPRGRVTPMARAVRVALDTWKKSFGARRAGPGGTPDTHLWRIETLEPKLLLSADAIPAVHLVVGDRQEGESVYRF